MHYFFEDLTGLAAGTVFALFLIVVPGFGIAELMRRARLISDGKFERTCWGLLAGPALLPAIDALLLRWLAFGSLLLAHLVLAAFAARPAFDILRHVRGRWWLAVLAGWLLVAWANVDVDWNGRLYQPLTILDGVKHAAVVASLAQHGVPLNDPFFARPGIAGYYYYFYLGPALIHWLGRSLIDSRAAFAAGTFTILLAFPAMLVLLAGEAKLIPEGKRAGFIRAILLLCCVSGLDLLPGLWMWIRTGSPLAQLDWWSEEVRWALTSVLWQPHHVAAVIAVFAGCLIVAGSGRQRLILRAAIAGTAFAAAFGCSLWIALAAVPILGMWWLYELAAKNSGLSWTLPLSGVTALALSLPQIRDIVGGRTMTGPPLAFYMRPLGPIRVLPHSVGEWIVHLAVTPGGYAIEFGIFALGAIVFLRRGGLASSQATPLGRLLLVSAPAALLMVTFIRSAVLYNDFGWRAVWFAQVPAMLWTASVLGDQLILLRTSVVWSAAMAFGLGAAAWDVTGIRLIRPYYPLSFVNAHPEVDYDLRGTYRWIEGTLPADLMVQHNPAGAVRAFDFGLYADRNVSVADGEAQLFGSNPAAVRDRIALLRPIFEHPMLASELRRRAVSAGAGGILLTSIDPLWAAKGGPPHDWTCRYRSQHSCVMLLERPR